MISKNLKIAIIGSGTAGLSAAAFLTKDNHDVTIFERFDTPKPLGAGLLLQPTGLAALANLNLDEKAINMGAKIHSLYGNDYDGSVIFDLKYRDLRPHYFGLGIHRGTLFSLLYDEVKRLKVPVITSCDITDTTLKNNKRFISDNTGKQYGPYDLVVDASGSRSVLRDKYGKICIRKPYPYGAIWGVCNDPGQKFGGNQLKQLYDSADVMIGILSIGKAPSDPIDKIAFFWSLTLESYSAWKKDGFESWKGRVINYWPELKSFVNQFESTDDLTFAQYNEIVMRKWDYNRLVFLGDAGHCTSPQLGQGANLALLDAMSLAKRIQEHEDVNTTLTSHTKIRKNHIIFYHIGSYLLTPFFQSDSKILAWIRNRLFIILCKTPYIKIEMLRTFAGLKTGLFKHVNPGKWHKKYDLNLK